MKIYALFDPKGNIVEIERVEWKCLVKAFDMQEHEFRKKYWHNETEADEEMKKLGWTVKEGEFIANEDLRTIRSQG